MLVMLLSFREITIFVHAEDKTLEINIHRKERRSLKVRYVDWTENN